MQSKTKEERQAIAKKGVETRRKNKQKRDADYEDAKLNKSMLHIQIKSLKEERDRLERHNIINAVSKKITNKSLLTEDEIVKNSLSMTNFCGVYFLIKEQSIVYVGQSVNLFSRVATHATEKDFDSIAYILCDKSMLDKLESLYIHTLRPELNGVNHGIICAPIMLDELLAT